MTIAQLLLGLIASQIFFAVTKVIFIQYLNIDNFFFIFLMWVILALGAITIIRRMGVLNYFEDFFTVALWTLTSLVVDLVITTSIVGRDVYTTGYFWLNYLVVILAVIIFHKKAHVEVRKQIREKQKSK
jgi:hypothetical protein